MIQINDILSRKERSKRMSLIKSKWTRPEKLIHSYLKGNKINHEMHPKINGSPDMIIHKGKIALFIHGCFWHGCSLHSKIPSNNRDFWRKKIMNNKLRDKRNVKLLRKNGWKTIIIWEHEIPRNKPEKSLRKIINQFNLT